MGFSESAILAFVSFFLVLSTAKAIFVKPENSLSGPYIGTPDGGNLAWWDLTGSAELADSVIRLTRDEQEKQGAIWNNFPNIMNDWEFHIQLHIHGKGVHVNGDGMALWYVREPLLQGPVYGYKDGFSGLGLFIDTFEDPVHPHNHKHPYISVVINDGSQHYEHDAEGTVTQVGGCHLQVRNLEWPVRVAISYISQVLAVYTDAEGNEQWSLCFSSHGVQLPTGYYFGVSASTGMVTDNHDVVSITTLDMTTEDKVYEDRTHVVPHAEFVEIPARPKSSEEVPEEQLQKVEVKRDVHQEEIMADPVAEFHHKSEEQQVPKVHHKPEFQTAPEVHHKPESQPAPEVYHKPESQPAPEVHHKPESQPAPEVHHKPKSQPAPEVQHHEPEKHQMHDPEHKHGAEKPKAKHRASGKKAAAKPSFWRKAVYIVGIGVLLYVAVSMFRSYMARRRERIQKRLY